jgi:hypothetical protein
LRITSWEDAADKREITEKQLNERTLKLRKTSVLRTNASLFEQPDGNEAYYGMIARGGNRSGNFCLRGSLRICTLATISYIFLFTETIKNSQFKISG